MTTATPPPAKPTSGSVEKPTRIAPIVTLDAKFFWEGADREEFLGQKCGDCGKFVFPPRPMCPHCHSLNRQNVKLSGRGTVHAWCVPRHPMPFGFRESPIVAGIKLEEGINFVSNIVGATIDEMKNDLPVEVAFEPTMNNHKVPVFRLRK